MRNTTGARNVSVPRSRSRFVCSSWSALAWERFRNRYLDTTECRLLSRGPPNSLRVGSTAKSSEKALTAIPESWRVSSAFPAEMQTQNSNSINRGRAKGAIRDDNSARHISSLKS